MGRDPNNDDNLVTSDFKSSETVGNTDRQSTGYLLLAQYGGQVVGNNGGTDYPARYYNSADGGGYFEARRFLACEHNHD
jgi:hypothetical protein